MCRFTEANTTHIEVTHVAVLAPTALTTTYNTTSKLRGTRCAYLN
jgi:hypothetical protein